MTLASSEPIVVLAAMLRLQEAVASFNSEIRHNPYTDDGVDVEERASALARRWADVNLAEAVYHLAAATAVIRELAEEVPE